MPIKFIGYGSLLSHESVSQTIPDRKFTPVLIKGLKRVFNVDMKPHSQEDLNVLNVEKDKQSCMNAIMMEINEEELAKLQDREEHYVFEKVTVVNTQTKEVYTDCLISINHDDDIDTQMKNPDIDYFKLCREAAYGISEEFGKIWDETTFTSDDKNIIEFLEQNPKYQSLKQKQHDIKTKKVRTKISAA